MRLRFVVEIPDENAEEFQKQVNSFLYDLVQKFGGKVLPESSSLGLEVRILNLLEEYSPRTFSEIQRKLGVPAMKVHNSLINLVNEGRVQVFEYSRGKGRHGVWYGIRNAKNLQPYWEKFFQILSDGKIHERDVVFELTGVPIPSPEAKFMEWCVPTYDNVVIEAGEYEGKFRFVYFLKGSEGEREWNEKVKIQAQQMGETPLGQGQSSTETVYRIS